ncbi:MAG: class D sortase [Clostridia bacterium]|nr:class D sortase [Clostridia bacterium]
MQNRISKTLKATIINFIVAFLVILIILGGVRLALGQKMDEAVTLLNYFAVNLNDKKMTEIVYEEQYGLRSYPEYGSEYATIEIDKIDVNLPVYFGSTLEILKDGVGHDSGSYFPGEGGSIIYMGHNSKNVFRRFSELQIGDMIKVNTTYGEFNYEIYDMKLIEEDEKDKLPIQRNEEILMIYTCYPFNNIGYTTQRYVVYSRLVK